MLIWISKVQFTLVLSVKLDFWEYGPTIFQSEGLKLVHIETQIDRPILQIDWTSRLNLQFISITNQQIENLKKVNRPATLVPILNMRLWNWAHQIIFSLSSAILFLFYPQFWSTLSFFLQAYFVKFSLALQYYQKCQTSRRRIFQNIIKEEINPEWKF